MAFFGVMLANIVFTVLLCIVAGILFAGIVLLIVGIVLAKNGKKKSGRVCKWIGAICLILVAGCVFRFMRPMLFS